MSGRDSLRISRWAKSILRRANVVFSPKVAMNPDLYSVRNERREILTEHGATGAPDLVVEILSPSTAQRDVGRKREIYAESGVEGFWVVSPKTQTVEVYRLREKADEPAAVLAMGQTLTRVLFPAGALRRRTCFASSATCIKRAGGAGRGRSCRGARGKLSQVRGRGGGRCRCRR